MCTRAYRPEAPDCLEDRCLFSGAAGPWADPVVLTKAKFGTVITQIRIGFAVFPRDPSISDLRLELSDAAVLIPFGRVDGLGLSINRILNTLHEDLSAKVRHALPRAEEAIIAVTRADVEAQVREGDVVVR